ncbi:MAG: rod shape-determining protein MreC [Candidatus Paceibacterota bacterium]
MLFIPRVLGAITAIIIEPIAQVETWLVNSNRAIPSYLRSQSEQSARESGLRSQLAEHAGAHLNLKRMREENTSLRSLLGATTTERIAAGVIGRPTELPYDVFLIDKGIQDGIVAQTPVYIANDQVVGFVAEVYQHTSVVTLVTTPNFVSTVYIYGPNIYTTAIGMGSGSMRVNVPQGIVLTEGDLVVIPSLDSGIYGEISVINSVPSRPEQYGYVTIDEPLTSVRYVSVGTVPLRTILFEEAKEVVDTVRTEHLSVRVPSGILVDVKSDIATTTNGTTTEITPLEI